MKFTQPSDKSQAAGWEFIKRKLLRPDDHDLLANDSIGAAQQAALGSYNVITEDRYTSPH